jgi:hypothetical protein
VSFSYSVSASAGAIHYSAASFCPQASALVSGVGTPNGTFSATPAGLSLDPATGAIKLSASAAGTYTVIYTVGVSGGCGATFNTTITILPKAVVNPVGNQYYCTGSSTAPIHFTGTATSYTWTNSKTAIGLPASGTGDLPSFTANSGQANITVTPRGNGSVNCDGKAIAFRFSAAACTTVHGPTDGDGSMARTSVTISLSPNPAVDLVRIDYKGNAARMTVEVRNDFGGVSIPARAFTGSTTTLFIGALTPGTYWVRLTDPKTGVSMQQKLVKL